MKELKQSKVKTPELDSILAVKEDSQRIGEFLEWLEEQEIGLAKWSDSEDTLFRILLTKEQLLANYFEIDLDKAEKERVALLDAVREDNS